MGGARHRVLPAGRAGAPVTRYGGVGSQAPLTEKQVGLILEIQRQRKEHGSFSPYRAVHAPESVMTGGWVERVDVTAGGRKARAVYSTLHTLLRNQHITAPVVAGKIDWTRVEVLTPLTDQGRIGPRGVITHHKVLGGGRTALIQASLVPGATAYGFCANSCPGRGIYEGDVLWLDGSIPGSPKVDTLYAVQTRPGTLEPGHVMLVVAHRQGVRTRWLDASSVDYGAPHEVTDVVHHFRVCAVLSNNMEERGGKCQDDLTNG